MNRTLAVFIALLMTTVSLAGCIGDGNGDDDGDEVMNDVDLCPLTPTGEAVDTDGCSQSQLDDDGDLVMNNLDLCPLTPTGETVDADGCSQSQLDDDGDGVANGVDICPLTPTGETADADGCHGGSVVAWGEYAWNYGNDTSTASSDLSSRVIEIFSTNKAFAALKSDGSVAVWGVSPGAGDCNPASNDTSWTSVCSDLSSGIIKIFSTYNAFAALKSDGSVVTWGHTYGGNSSSVSSDLSSGVIDISSTYSAFAALKSDGSVVTWGSSNYGGNSSSVSSELSSGVVEIYSTSGAFAALKSDGSVVTWGATSSGGNSSHVSSELNSRVIQIYSSDNVFVAIVEID